jgi:hypothetical protein
MPSDGLFFSTGLATLSILPLGYIPGPTFIFKCPNNIILEFETIHVKFNMVIIRSFIVRSASENQLGLFLNVFLYFVS